MTDKRLNNVEEQCMSCIKCDSDFDSVTGLWELVGKRFGIDKSNSWWYLTNTKEKSKELKENDK